MAVQAKANSKHTPRWVRYINPVNWVKGIGRFFLAAFRFIRDSYYELRRITWPEKARIFRSTGVVFSTVLIMTLFIWLVDTLFNQGVSYLLKLIG
jgi:preprotein translocase subunit SecE